MTIWLVELQLHVEVEADDEGMARQHAHTLAIAQNENLRSIAVGRAVNKELIDLLDAACPPDRRAPPAKLTLVLKSEDGEPAP